MLTWEFYRQIGSVDAAGGVIHYYDEQSQSLYLKNGLITKIAKVPEGHWAGAALSGGLEIGDYDYNLLSFDHPHNGTLYGVAAEGDDLYYLRYVYALELSGMLAAGQWQEQVDNQIKQLSLDVKNVSPEIFAPDNTLFNPGAKITLAFTAGDSEAYPIGAAYVDDVDYDAYAPTVPLSARNTIGVHLADQTFDDQNYFSGSRSAVFAGILAGAGVRDYLIQEDGAQTTLEFEPDTAILEGLNESLKSIGWRMIDLPSGQVIIGDESFLAGHLANSRYVFNGGGEVFKRKTSKNADAAYTRVCVRSREEEGGMVFAEVPHWQYWSLGARKTKYHDAPEGYTAEQMLDLASFLAEELQYVGIGEAFASPLRPYLLVGDIAEIYYTGDIESTSLGLITDIKHSFGDSGFFTDFNIDSGGYATDADEYSIVSRAAVLDGYNRRQRVLDFIGIVAEKKAVSIFAGGGQIIIQSIPAEALSISPAGTMRIL